jgi:hypothetical protein
MNYKSFQRSIQKFNNELKFFLNTITETANDILNNHLSKILKSLSIWVAFGIVNRSQAVDIGHQRIQS